MSTSWPNAGDHPDRDLAKLFRAQRGLILAEAYNYRS